MNVIISMVEIQQGYGKNLSIMQGMFRANGGCGYIKKPDVLLHNTGFNPNIKGNVKKILKVSNLTCSCIT